MDNNSENLFPSSFDPKEEKASKTYILKYSKDLWGAAQAETTSYSFDSRRERYKLNRQYSEGLNSIEKFKQQFSTTGDNTYLNFDWSVSTPLPKFSEVMRGQMINQPFKPQFTPVDSISLTEYDKEKQVIRAKMAVKKELAPLIEKGVIPEPKDIPEDDDELEVYMQTSFKLAQSMAMESITKAVLQDNDIDYINTRIAKDLIDLKICAVRVCLDENKNIKVEYIDPVNLVTSYVSRPDFRDVRHVGVLKKVSVEDLRVQAAGQLSEEDIFDIAKTVAGKYENKSWNDIGGSRYYNNAIDRARYDKFNVMVLDYEFFSTDDMTVTKVDARNGGRKTLINEEAKNSKRTKKESTKKVKNVYCAHWVVDTDYIYDYGLKKNIVRERLNGRYSTNTTLGFVVNAPDIYDMENKSKVEEMIPSADALIRIQLKLQQFIGKAAPAGYAINIDAFVGGLEGMGMGNLKPMDARAIRDQIGDVYYKSLREDGTSLTGGVPPIQDLPNGLNNSVMLLGQAYVEELQRMKEVIGMNDAVDASQPDKRAAVGVQKLASSAHKNALRTLYNAYLKVNEDVVRQVAILAQQLIRKGINKEKFENMVGQEAVKQLDITRLSASDFAIAIQMLPDEEEKAYIDSKVELALMSQPPMITLQDAFTIRRVANEDVDKAEQLLGIREKKQREKKQKEQEAIVQMQAQQQAQLSQVQEQNKQQTLQLEAQADIQKKTTEYDLRKRNEKALELEKRITIQVELEGKIKLLERASELESQKMGQSESSDKTAYDKVNLPKASGSRMPSMGTTPPQV